MFAFSLSAYTSFFHLFPLLCFNVLQHFKCITYPAIMIWLTVTYNIFVTDDHGYVHNLVRLSSFMTYQKVFNMSNLLVVTSGSGTYYPFKASEFVLVSCEVRACHIVQCITYLHVFSSVL